jgi:hypothetical protein
VALDFQVTVDCTEPHQLAEWWAEALEWEVERQDAAFIQRMIDEGHASEADTTIHAGELKWRTGAAIVADVAGTRRRILFQFVPEPKTVKNRLHLDIRTSGEDLNAVRHRLEGLGATFLHDGRQGPNVWVTMRDPDGNEFCIT